jgi:radical SAM protein with 4Fe4S-binding SPASM domain
MSGVAPPRELQLEVTGACNLRCQMCLVRYRPALDRHEASLDFERFRALVDAVPGLERVTLQGLGEPLMAPDLIAMLEYGRARGIRMGFNTNGTLLTATMTDRLLDAAPDWLCVSIDGATAATYESIRDGARFDRVIRNVRRFVARMRERGAQKPDLSLVMVAMRRNVAELPALVRLAAECGVPTLRVQNLSHSFSDCDPAGAYREIREFSAAEALWQNHEAAADLAFAEARALAVELGVALRLPELDEPAREPGAPGCDWPWRSAYVRHDGRVQPCCMLMGGDRAILGDLKRSSFTEIWQSPGYERFRAALMTDKPPDVCRGCSMYRGVF